MLLPVHRPWRPLERLVSMGAREHTGFYLRPAGNMLVVPGPGLMLVESRSAPEEDGGGVISALVPWRFEAATTACPRGLGDLTAGPFERLPTVREVCRRLKSLW